MRSAGASVGGGGGGGDAMQVQVQEKEDVRSCGSRRRRRPRLRIRAYWQTSLSTCHQFFGPMLMYIVQWNVITNTILLKSKAIASYISPTVALAICLQT